MKKTKILFIHHSTGANLIRQGNLREELYKLDANLEFWDHNYNLFEFPSLISKFLANFTNHQGLSDAKGKIAGKDYDIYLSNNSPKEYVEIFSRDKNDKTLKNILEFDVIAFKNCFPTTKIESDQQLEEYKNYYQKIKRSLTKYPDKKFILLTSPPLRESATTAENAKRAKELNSWLLSEEFLEDSKNLQVFDFFGLLADDQGYLRADYQPFLPKDSHPNKKANQDIAPIFADYLVNAVKS